jgi:hypothetical protein
MTIDIENPYRSPEAKSIQGSLPVGTVEVSWKAIAKRWEILRIPYNFIVGLAGLLALAMIPAQPWYNNVFGVVAYGLGANALYLLGPIAEMYLNWCVDVWGGRLLPAWAARFVRSPYLTALLFVGGSLFSVGLTLMIGVSEAFAAGLADH